MVKKDILASSRKLRRKRIALRTGVLVIVALFLCAGFVGLFYIQKFRIQKVSAKGNYALNKKEIIENISDSLNGKYFGIFPRDNIFIIPKEEIKSNLLAAFPRVKSVFLNRDFPNSLFVEIKERKPAALFCENNESALPALPNQGEPTDKSTYRQGKCSFVGEDGFIFGKAALFSGNVYLKFYREGGGNGKTITQLKNLMEFVKLASKENIKITKIILAGEELRKFYTSEGWYILLNNNNDTQITFENLKLALENKIKENRKYLDYIDLRFGNKVYYKFK
ncbi:MAG TPA: FtsQ-type POTRA domain-containing protein [Candidatus Campbellbacteria bacterium]|nr:FtsQ-type POTRA domain-containing protein [Candidatus Campbellbacteria bacterium]